MDSFISTPQKGAVLRDWTKKTLVLDVQNSIGEKFHFEIEPVADGEKINLPPKYGSTGWGEKCQLDFVIMR